MEVCQMAWGRIYLWLPLVAIVWMTSLQAQDSSRFQFSGYGELYYGYDFSRPANNERPFFLYNHKRHNEVALNLAMVKASYQENRTRANAALMVGNYAQYNLAAEPVALRLIYEANIGVRLSQKHDVWLIAGIMPSHIGFESAIGADHWTASRSMVADNSPYYETGLKLTASNKRKTHTSSFLFLNGWQHIQRPDGVNRPALGMQFTYKPAANITLNYSNFFGSDKPDSLDAWRFYNNCYAIVEGNRWGLITGFDLGRDRGINHQYAWWYTPVVIVRRILDTRSRMAVRAEYFNDLKEALVATGRQNGFETLGLSLNFDHNIRPNLLVRIEGKGYFAPTPLYKEETSRQNFLALATMSLRL